MSDINDASSRVEELTDDGNESWPLETMSAGELETTTLLTEYDIANVMAYEDIYTYLQSQLDNPDVATAAEAAEASQTTIYDAVIRYFEENQIQYDMKRVLHVGAEFLARKPAISEDRPIALLKVFLDPAAQAAPAAAWREHIEKHNDHILNDPHPNAGFDLLFPPEVVCAPAKTTFVNPGIKCAMHFGGYGAAFYLYPRSSISKTALMMHNSAGIIDECYRGPIIAALRNFGTEEVAAGTLARIVQICHPSLCPIYVQLVASEEELGRTTRGGGGFGSTGGAGAGAI